MQEQGVLKQENSTALETLSNALDVFAGLSHLHSREIGGLKDTKLSIDIEQEAKQSVDNIRNIQRKIEEFKKS